MGQRALSSWMAWAVVSGFFISGCPGGGGSSHERALQCDCVHDSYEDGYFLRELPVGERCLNVAIGGCGCLASECIDYCANDVCQAVECETDADCAAFGSIAECVTWDDDAYGDLGRWCDPSPACPRGQPGCPCASDESCSGSGNGITVSCNTENVCESVDSCPSGCRASTVCCGGALCAGDCIGTPCC